MRRLTTSSLFKSHVNPLVLTRIVWVQVVLFAILYAIWILPETTALRHICLVIGAVLGLYEIIHFRALLMRRAAIPVWLLLGLFVWATFHLLFLSSNFDLQLQEFTSIWKRVALGTIFALGLGLAFTQIEPQKRRDYWPLFYLGLLAPTLIYIAKYLLSHHGKAWGFNIPEYLDLHYSANTYYIAKTSYVCLCLPTLAVALGQLLQSIRNHVWFSRVNIIYALTIPAVIFVFSGENIKNGIVYSGLLILIFAFFVLTADFKKHWVAKVALAASIALMGSVFLMNHIQKNESWKTLILDAKVALDTDTYDHWKCFGAKGYPNNELGKMVSVTNYERIAWGKIGLTLVPENPLGYGMIEQSFGHLTKQKWPESCLRQSHSGWLDLALGMGIPGLVLVLGALIGSMVLLGSRCQGIQSPDSVAMNHSVLVKWDPWSRACRWILLASLVMWCTTEISQRIFFDSLIFWIALSSGLAAGFTSRIKGKDECALDL